MRNMYHTFFAAAAFLLITTIGGCKKFVSIPAPPTEVVTSSVFSSDANATAAMTSIYTKMESTQDLAELSYDLGLMADELTNYSAGLSQIQYYINNLQASTVTNPWVDGYNYIYQANAVISGLQTNGGVSAIAKQQLTGEAEFIRAFWHFYLTSCYGPVPVITSPDYNINATATRAPVSQVYAQIITDLKDAENLLNPNFVDATDSTITTDRVRPTRWAAAAMLARVYLYNGVYDSAEQQSTLVLNDPNNLFQLCQSLDSVFLMNNTEAIWQVPPVQPASNLATPEGQVFVIYTAPSGDLTYNDATISPQLMSSFETGDARQTEWVGDYNSSGIDYYYPAKYKQYNTSTVAEYSVMLRLGEQYLIRAEARAQQGNAAGALADLNVIRNRAGLAAYAGPTDQATLLSAILHERQVELFSEIGHRWFDLSRTGNINPVMSVVTPLKGGAWSSDWAVFPLPVTELKSDPKLIQNSGY